MITAYTVFQALSVAFTFSSYFPASESFKLSKVNLTGRLVESILKKLLYFSASTSSYSLSPQHDSLSPEGQRESLMSSKVCSTTVVFLELDCIYLSCTEAASSLAFTQGSYLSRILYEKAVFFI